MPENEVLIKYKLNEDVRDILISYFKTKPFTEVEDAINFLKDSTEIDGQSFRSIISYLSHMPWIEVDSIMKVISSTTEKISLQEDEVQPVDESSTTNS